MHVHHRIRKPKSNDNCLNYMNIAPVNFSTFMCWQQVIFKGIAWLTVIKVTKEWHLDGTHRVFSHQGATALKQSPVIMLHF